MSMVLLVTAMASLSADPKPTAPYVKPTLIAHRGASAYAPEHTIEAYKLAMEQRADFIEPDLQITKDGILVCLHDTTLERTTNIKTVFPDRAVEVKGKKTWPVSAFTLDEIKTLDAGSWKDAKYAGAKVPTFQEMIDTVKGKAGIIPETKAPEAYDKLGFDMGGLMMAVLKKNGLDTPGADPKTPVIVQSFSAESLKSLRTKHNCKLPLVYLFGKAQTKDELAKMKSFADGIAPNKAAVLDRPEMVRDAHDLGMSVTVWTFRSGQTGKFETVKQEMKHFLQTLHVDALFTDNPDEFPRK